MGSAAYSQWLNNRLETKPIPSNPYQAYMIDLSLQAKIETRKKWESAPNESDQIAIDFPYGEAPNYVPTRAPAHKPTQRGGERDRSPEMPKEGLHRDLQLAADAMATRYGIPAPIVQTFSGGINRSYARVGVGRFHNQLVRAGGGVVSIGIRNDNGRKLTPIEYGTLYHEVGHVIHAQASVLPEGKRPKNMANLFTATPLNYSDEHFATMFAKEEIHRTIPVKGGQRAAAKWDLRYALETYKRGWKQRGKPVVITKEGTILSGGSY